MSIPFTPGSFQPPVGPYQKYENFYLWVQKTLPTIYDDTLSYQELLAKVLYQLNLIGEQGNQITDDVTALSTAYGELQDWANENIGALVSFVNDYFDNLDVQQEINNKLNAMAQDGSLSALLDPIVALQIPDIVTGWLGDHVDPETGYVVDNSLTIQGAAADAKAAGDAIAEVKSQVNAFCITNSITPTWNQGYLRNADGKSGNDNNYCYCNFIAGHNSAFVITGVSGYTTKVALYSSPSENDFDSFLVTLTSDHNIEFVVNAGDYIRIQYGKGTEATTPESITSAVFTLTEKIPTDTTLTHEYKPADAKATGDLKAAFEAVSESTRNLWTFGNQSFTKNKTIQPFNLTAGTYTVSAEIINSPATVTQARFYAFYADNTYVSGILDATGQRDSATVTFEGTVVKIRIDAATTLSASEGVTSSWSDIQIEKNESATPYVPPTTAIDNIARDSIETLEETIEQDNKEQMTRKTLGANTSLFDDHDGYLYWGGWANADWFTENLPDNSNIYTTSNVLSFGSGDYSRGAIAVQRTPLAFGVFSKDSASGTFRAGTAKLTPWRKSIAFFGDSIMWGRDGDIDTVTQVSKTIPTYCGMNLGCRSINKGVGSQGWIATGGGRNALAELQNYSNLSSEDIIVLCWGVNDLHDHDVGDWQNPASDTIMYQVGLCVDYIYTVNPTAVVVIVAPWNSPSYGSAPKYKYGTDKWQTMESAEKNYCEYWGIPFISQADSPFNGKNMLAFFSTITTDRVHPTQKGYERLGNWLAAKLSIVI